jgi:hypothetical protein
MGREHATGFDKKYMVTFAGGKEWQVGRNNQNLIQVNFKMVAGAQPVLRRLIWLDLN